MDRLTRKVADRSAAFHREARQHYEGDPADEAAWIASEVIRKGRSHGWSEEPEEKTLAAEVEKILSKFNVGYAGNGIWEHRPGGSEKVR